MFVRFTNYDGNAVIVNTKYIQCIRVQGGKTRIDFMPAGSQKSGDQVTVKETSEQVQTSIVNAIRFQGGIE